jgi:hypothetical protein
MADEQELNVEETDDKQPTLAAQEQPGGDTATTPPAEAKTTETEKQQSPMIPKSRFDEVNEKYKQAAAELQKQREAQANAELEQKKKQGKFEELYQETLAREKALEASIAEQKLNQVKMQVASKAGFPQMWSRLSGNDEAEIEADIQALIEALPKPQAPSLDGGAGGRSREQVENGKITEAQKKMLQAKYGVLPKYIE